MSKEDYLIISIVAFLFLLKIILQSCFKEKPFAIIIDDNNPFYAQRRTLAPSINKCDKRLYEKGYQAFGDKLWKCNDDPCDLTTISCGPDDYSLFKKQLLKKIQHNEKLCDNSSIASPVHQYRKEIATDCAYNYI